MNFALSRITSLALSVLVLATTTACGGGSDTATKTPIDLAPATPVVAVPVEAGPVAPMVQLCSGVTADSSGVQPASTAIQTCIDKLGSNGTLALPAGTYLVDTQIKIVHPFTLTTKGLETSTRTCTDGAACATLKAAPAFSEQHGILLVGGAAAQVSNVTIDHISIDGNRAARLESEALKACVANKNTFGFNATVKNCTTCKFTYSSSTNAVCGTALVWTGTFSTIDNNIFANNGNHFVPSTWADGLSMEKADDSSVQNNRFIDNSDIGMISFGSARTVIKGNIIIQENTPAFAGMMLDSLFSGDFTDALVTENTVKCAPSKCFFAFNIGPSPWYPQNKTVTGGRVINNSISGGNIGLSISGVDARLQTMLVENNNVLGTYDKTVSVPCLRQGSVTTSAVTVDPDSSRTVFTLGVNYNNNLTVEPTRQTIDHCIN